jgi:hypothetical protein
VDACDLNLARAALDVMLARIAETAMVMTAVSQARKPSVDLVAASSGAVRVRTSILSGDLRRRDP